MNDSIPNEIAPYQMVIEDAVKKVLAGQNEAAVVEAMLAQLPTRLRDAIKRRFEQMLHASRRGEDTQIQEKPSGRVAQLVFNMGMMANLVAQATLNKIRQLLQSRPDIANALAKEGSILANYGVTPDMVKVSEESLGNVVSNVSKDQNKERDTVTR